MEDKAKIPGPDKYECNVHRKDFNDQRKKSKIFTHERKSSVLDAIEESKKFPGVGRYDVFGFDEKKNKPPKLGKSNKDEKILETDIVIQASKQVPFHINDSKMVSINPFYFKL